MRFMSDLLSKFSSMRAVLMWLIIGPLKESKRDVLRVTTLQGLSVLFQVAGFVIVIKFVGLLLNNWTLAFLGFEFDLQESRITAFWLVITASLLFLLLGAAFSFLARKTTAKLARVTEERVLLQVTRAFVQALTQVAGREALMPDLNTLKSFYNRGGRFAGRMVMAATSALVPLVMLGISLCLMLYLKPVLTLLLMLILVLTGPVFFHIARKGRQAAEDLLANARNSTLDRNWYIDCMRHSMIRPVVNDQESWFWINETTATQGFMKAYEKRLRITALSTFFTQAAIAIMLTAILLTAIYPAVLGRDMIIVSTMAYLAAFKFFGSGLIASINAFVTLNVFYSYCQNLVPFLEQAQKMTTSPDRGQTEAMLQNHRDSEDLFRLAPASPLLVNLHTSVEWSNMALLISALARHLPELGQDWADRSRLLSLRFPLAGDELPSQMQLADGETVTAIIDGLHQIGARNKNLRKQLRYVQPASFSSGCWGELSPEIKLLAKGLMLSENSDSLVVFIDGKGFISMPVKLQHELLNLLANHYVLVIIPGQFKHKRVSVYLFKTMACITPDGLNWIGDFQQAKKESITVQDFVEHDDLDGSEMTELLEDM